MGLRSVDPCFFLVAVIAESLVLDDQRLECVGSFGHEMCLECLSWGSWKTSWWIALLTVPGSGLQSEQCSGLSVIMKCQIERNSNAMLPKGRHQLGLAFPWGSSCLSWKCRCASSTPTGRSLLHALPRAQQSERLSAPAAPWATRCHSGASSSPLPGCELPIWEPHSQSITNSTAPCPSWQHLGHFNSSNVSLPPDAFTIPRREPKYSPVLYVLFHT